MCAFSCVVGESLRIGDVARIHIRRVVKGSDEDEVWLAIEWSGNERTPFEVIARCDPKERRGTDVVN